MPPSSLAPRCWGPLWHPYPQPWVLACLALGPGVPPGCSVGSRAGHALPASGSATPLPKPMLSRPGAVCSPPSPCPVGSWLAPSSARMRTIKEQSWAAMSRAVKACVGAYIKGSIFILLLVCFSQNTTPQLTALCVIADHSELMHGLLW